MLERIVCLAVGYVLGLFQTSYIYGRKQGIDIREHGSGNAGTTNAFRTMGKKAGALTLLGDILKCVLAMVIARLLFGGSYGDNIRLLELYAGAGCILGHNFPFYLKFKGGKGIAASVGLLLAFDWRIFLICAVVFFLLFFKFSSVYNLFLSTSAIKFVFILSQYLSIVAWYSSPKYSLPPKKSLIMFVYVALLILSSSFIKCDITHTP